MIGFLKKGMQELTKGNRWYFAWLGLLIALIAVGIFAYTFQARYGMIMTNMRDQVSWAFYIGNFTFFVGVAAASVLLVIPAYVYHFKPIKEIVLFGEMIAITALIICMLFITADLGNPLKAWHTMPVIGKMNFPVSLLAWDIVSLTGYLVINTVAVFYILYSKYQKKEYKMSVLWPIILISIPWAISIHTVTAFLYNGLSSRPFWNASILAPRFIASALCSGPAIMILIFQIARRVSDIKVDNAAIFKIAELMAFLIAFNLFLFGAEMFKEFYSDSIHLAPLKFMYFGLHGHYTFVPWMWMAFIFNVGAFIIFLRRRIREDFRFLNFGCVILIIGVFIEKGMGLIIPGFIPGTLGEIYIYTPSMVEIGVSIGIIAFGVLFYTLLVKVALPIYKGVLTKDS